MRVPLAQIVSLYLSENDTSSHAYQRIYTIAQRGRLDLDMDVTGRLNTVNIDINFNKTGSLPPDFINYVRVGLVNSNGEIESLSYNHNLTAFKGLDYDRLNNSFIVADQNIYNAAVYPNQTAGVNILGTFQSLGVGSAPTSRANFKIDKQANIIMLNPTATTQTVVMEYLSSGKDDVTEESISIEAQEALLAWCGWKDIQGNKGPANAVMMLRKEYYNQKRIAKGRRSGMQLHHINEAVRETTMKAINY